MSRQRQDELEGCFPELEDNRSHLSVQEALEKDAKVALDALGSTTLDSPSISLWSERPQCDFLAKAQETEQGQLGSSSPSDAPGKSRSPRKAGSPRKNGSPRKAEVSKQAENQTKPRRLLSGRGSTTRDSTTLAEQTGERLRNSFTFTEADIKEVEGEGTELDGEEKVELFRRAAKRAQNYLNRERTPV
eukprot:CAMPEP_0118955998 /NCGR_PEP_ID=MMETSP1169-20130426/60883_1 /TAXON_ID=36882 /ORGANISM="Pyramimonas obovata, Strain CCMP722" /LENGTH=188 /DNA_ID=CAMNT_0006903943 /DNA_START=145 /DNA_END=708 /DNA_ORIENTATION=+